MPSVGFVRCYGSGWDCQPEVRMLAPRWYDNRKSHRGGAHTLGSFGSARGAVSLEPADTLSSNDSVQIPITSTSCGDQAPPAAWVALKGAKVPARVYARDSQAIETLSMRPTNEIVVLVNESSLERDGIVTAVTTAVRCWPRVRLAESIIDCPRSPVTSRDQREFAGAQRTAANTGKIIFALWTCELATVEWTAISNFY